MVKTYTIHEKLFNTKQRKLTTLAVIIHAPSCGMRFVQYPHADNIKPLNQHLDFHVSLFLFSLNAYYNIPMLEIRQVFLVHTGQSERRARRK